MLQYRQTMYSWKFGKCKLHIRPAYHNYVCEMH